MSKFKNIMSKASVPWIIAILCIGLGLYLFGYTVSGQKIFDAELMTLNQEKLKLEQELEGLMLTSTPDIEYVSAKLYSAANVGNYVARLQTEYRLAQQTWTSKPERHDEIQAELRRLFPDIKDSHMPWVRDGDTSKPYTWIFTTNHEVADSVIPVLFMCYPHSADTDNLLMWVEAVYDAEEGIFTNLSTSRFTARGMNYFNLMDLPGEDGLNPHDHGDPMHLPGFDPTPTPPFEGEYPPIQITLSPTPQATPTPLWSDDDGN